MYNVLSAVTDFVKNPSANFGFILINSRMAQEMDVVSSEGTDQSLRPKLTISYEETTLGISEKRTRYHAAGTISVGSATGHLFFSGATLTAPVDILVTTASGRSVHSGRLLPGTTATFFGMSTGLFMVSYVQENGTKHAFPVLVP